MALRGTATKCQVRSLCWLWHLYSDSSPIFKSSLLRDTRKLESMRSMFKILSNLRVQYSLTDKFWDSERSQTAAVKWISLKYFEDHSVLEWEVWIHFFCYTLRSQHEQWPFSLSLARLLHACSESQLLMRALRRTAGVGTSASVKLPLSSSFLEKMMRDTTVFLCILFYLQISSGVFIWNAPFDLDLEGSLFAI